MAYVDADPPRFDVPACRVRTLVVKTREPASVQKATSLLEDALRILSIPGREERRIYYVRRFALPSFTLAQSSSALALTIQQHLRHLLASAVHATHDRAARASCIFFSHPLEPFTILAVNIARDKETRAWFWPLAVPRWRSDSTGNEGLRTILASVLAREEGPVAAATLLATLDAAGGLHRLLASLRPQDGPVLCRSIGWDSDGLHRSRDTRMSESMIAASKLARPLWRIGREWIAHWGVNDARSLWLLAMTHIARSPHLSAHHDRLLQLVRSHAAALEPETNEPDGVATTLEPQARLDRDLRSSESTTHALSQDIDRPPPTLSALDRDSANGHLSPQGLRYRQPLFPFAAGSEETMSLEKPVADGKHILSPQQADQPKSARDLSGAVHRSPSVAGRPEPTDIQTDWPVSGSERYKLETQWGGLFFLLHAFSRLRFIEWLDEHPAFVEWDLPRHVFRLLLDRMEVPEYDGIRAALSPVPEDEPYPVTHFMAPISWWSSLRRGKRLYLRPVDDRPDSAILYDRSLRLPLALWTEPASPRFRASIARHPIRRLTASRPGLTIADIVEGWSVAIDRWCRSVTGHSLLHVIHRPAYVSVTRTHIDVIFRLDQIDIDIRKGGLDIDPGWVPWFGRVVAFHYTDEEP